MVENTNEVEMFLFFFLCSGSFFLHPFFLLPFPLIRVSHLSLCSKTN